MTKNFSIMKWIIFPLLVAAFGAGIIFVSIKIFGFDGSVPSILLVVTCLAISLIFVLHTSNHKVKSAMIAAFTFECLGVCALGITLICSIVVLREFSGATQTIATETATELAKESEKTKQITAIGSLKSARAQNSIAKNLSSEPASAIEKITLTSVYDKAEKFLLWPLIAEATIYLIGLLVVFGLVQFLGENEDFLETPQPRQQNKTQRLQFTANNAPLRVSSAHTVDNGNGFFLSLSPSGAGKSIRFRERGNQAEHVLRVSEVVVEREALESLDYKRLAQWTLRALEAAGKSSKPVYKKIEGTL